MYLCLQYAMNENHFLICLTFTEKWVTKVSHGACSAVGGSDMGECGQIPTVIFAQGVSVGMDYAVVSPFFVLFFL